MKRLLWISAPLAAAIAVFAFFPRLIILSDDEVHEHGTGAVNGRWACPMLCVVVDSPGLCPVCGMELEEITASSGDITLSAAERELSGLSFVHAVRIRLQHRMSLPGTVTGAETSRAVVTAWTSGRIDRFPAPATGESVRNGETVAWIYSPELIEAQHDLLYAFNALDTEGALLEGARHRLRQLGASDWIISHLEETGEIMESLPVVSRYTGTVMERHVESGDWVRTGQVLLDVANLGDIWIESELLEGQTGLVSTGDSVTVLPYTDTASIPGEITHMDPFYDPVSMSVTARIQATSPETVLLPGELVRVLVSTEVGGSNEPDLAVPASSVLSLGSRHIVYVLPSAGTASPSAPVIPSPEVGVSLVPRLVELEPLAYSPGGERYYPVISGLLEGDIVADDGAFLLDSQAELTGITSLMNEPDPI